MLFTTDGLQIVAPSDEAFSKLQGFDLNNATLVTAVLQYHILQGAVTALALPAGPPKYVPSLLKNRAYTNVTAGQNVIVYRQSGDTIILASGAGSRSTVVQPDDQFAGGSVQMVDTLLVVPDRLEKAARDTYPRDLTSFLGALYAAGLESEVADAENVTIFAPNNVAFQRVAGALEGMPPEQLKQVLRYHVVPGRVVESTSFSNGSVLATSESGKSLKTTKSGNNAYVDSAMLVQPDTLIANGVVHIIDNGKPRLYP
jgi:transforming growth factor-beta-induced protein